MVPVQYRGQRISIHALLAESDIGPLIFSVQPRNFYPRSPCGERQPSLYELYDTYAFLSTLSLRRATNGRTDDRKRNEISIHALLAESDLRCWKLAARDEFIFLSTLSLRRATNNINSSVTTADISIHALLAESDPIARQ